MNTLGTGQAPGVTCVNLQAAGWLICTYLSEIRVSSSPDELPTPVPDFLLVKAEDGSKVTLSLYHGRYGLEETLNEWGFTAPGEPLTCDAVYLSDTHITLVTMWPDGTGDTRALRLVNDLVEYQGALYGDFSVDHQASNA